MNVTVLPLPEDGETEFAAGSCGGGAVTPEPCDPSCAAADVERLDRAQRGQIQRAGLPADEHIPGVINGNGIGLIGTGASRTG